MSPMEDPFNVKPSELRKSAELVTGGRYRLPNRDGTHHKGGWTRATNLAASISDTKALGDWEQRMVLLGLRQLLLPLKDLLPLAFMSPTDPLRTLLVEPLEDLEPGKLRSLLMGLAAQLKGLAKADAGATQGSLAHRMVEDHHAGLPSQLIPDEILAKLPLYVTKLDAHRLEPLAGMQERQVMVEALNGVGTLDNIMRDLLAMTGCSSCQDTGFSGDQAVPGGACWDCRGQGWTPVGRGMWPDKIADLKTQKRFWSWLETTAQLAFYAHGDAMWDAALGRWVDMPPVNRELGVVAWMPTLAADGSALEHPVVDIYEVDLTEGWETLLLAHKVHARRAAAKSVRNPWGWLRPLPRASVVEAYARRLHEVETQEEASRVYEDAARGGFWGPELEQVAQEILPRLLTAK